MKRERILFHPVWDGAIANWAKSYISKNLWRIQPYYDFTDAYHDAYLKFEICKKRYPHVIEAKHFMSLFQKAVQNHIHTISSDRTHHVPSTSFEFEDSDDNRKGPLDSLVEIASADFCAELSAATDELQELLKRLHESEEAFNILEKYRKQIDEVANIDKFNECLCRIIEADPSKLNLAQQLLELLDTDENSLQI